MNLLEKDIEDIIYNSIWLLDERYVIPQIKGVQNEFGRKINIGKNGLNRYIDLLFKDTRDNRPVIVKLKKHSLTSENIHQILQYRALVVSMDEESRMQWQQEFGQNYYCPKLILAGTEASDEVRISANLAGIEIRTLAGVEELEVNFSVINDITYKLNNWNKFLNTGNRSLEDRDRWIEKVYKWTKDVINEYGNKDVTTVENLYTTSPRDAWVTDSVFPFINLPLYYKDRYLCGLYEYYDEQICFSDEYIYFDFLVQSIHYNEYKNHKRLEAMVISANELLLNRGYHVFNFDDGMGAVRISRNILNRYDEFKKALVILIADAIYINDEMFKKFSE